MFPRDRDEITTAPAAKVSKRCEDRLQRGSFHTVVNNTVGVILRYSRSNHERTFDCSSVPNGISDAYLLP
jgi:hypothetical protein